MTITTTTMTPDAIAKMVATHVHSDLEKRIKAELRPIADKILAQVAREMADSIVANVQTYREFDEKKIHLTLVFNTEKIEISP